MVQVRQAKAATPAEMREREAAAVERLLELGLRPSDTIRFEKPRRPSQVHASWQEGRPLDIGADGSVSCIAGGLLRAIRPEKVQVKMRGPRGGVQWLPLIEPEEET